MKASTAMHLAAALSAGTLVAACQSPGGIEGQSAPQVEVTANADPTALTAGPRDSEAPEVFHVTDQGLWDGRPSLGGVWVAHPTVTDPERVIIRNEANGQYVVGALFRRERDNPGPQLQVSSDAAAALGMLAGSPARLDVTALRRDDPKPAPEPEAQIASADPAESGETAAAASVAGDIAASPSAEASETAAPTKKRGLLALFRRDRTAPAETAPVEAAAVPQAADTNTEGAELAAATTAALGTGAIETAPVAEPPKKRGLFGLFRKSRPAEADPAGAAIASEQIETATLPTGDSTTATAAALDSPAAAAPPLAAEPATKKRGLFGLFRKSDPAAATDQETAALPAGDDTMASGATFDSAAASSEPAPAKPGLFGFLRRKQSDAPLSALGDPASGPGAVIAAGTYADQSKALAAADTLRASGFYPTLREANGGWRVLVGTGGADRTAVLDKVKALGFPEAYAGAG